MTCETLWKVKTSSTFQFFCRLYTSHANTPLKWQRGQLFNLSNLGVKKTRYFRSGWSNYSIKFIWQSFLQNSPGYTRFFKCWVKDKHNDCFRVPYSQTTRLGALKKKVRGVVINMPHPLCYDHDHRCKGYILYGFHNKISLNTNKKPIIFISILFTSLLCFT